MTINHEYFWLCFIYLFAYLRALKNITFDVELIKIVSNIGSGDIYIGGGGTGKIFHLTQDYVRSVRFPVKNFKPINLSLSYQVFDYSLIKDNDKKTPNLFNNPRTTNPTFINKNNINKINFLVLSPNYGGYLLACGSKYYEDKSGIRCTVHDLLNIYNYKVLESNKPENVFSSNISSYAFYAPGPSIIVQKNSQVLYVGYTYDSNRPYTLSPLSLSSRQENIKKLSNKIPFNNHINPSSKLNFEYSYAYDDGTAFTGINIAPNYHKDILIKYLYGFSHQGFSYFLTLQNNSINNSPDKTFQTRIVRVCQEDLSYFSYTEIPITCFSSPDQFEYNIAQAAYFGPYEPDPESPPSTNSLHSDTALYVSMTSSYPNFHLDEPNPSLGSTLCIYPISDIVTSFREAVQRCYDGIGDHIPWIVGVKEKCVRANKTITDDFCGSSINFPIETDIDLFARTVHRFSDIITSLAVQLYPGSASFHRAKGYVIAFLGSENGHVRKVLLESQTAITLYTSNLFAQTDIPSSDNDSGAINKAIKSSTAFSSDNLHIYFLSFNKLFAMPLNSCTLYGTCGECLNNGIRDPLNCGWCSQGNMCSTSDECLINQWTQSHCTPSISTINPLSGPKEGGTIITIDGDYFGNLKSSRYNVQIAGKQCQVINATMNRIVITTPTGHNLVGSMSSVSVEVSDRSKQQFGYTIEGSTRSTSSFVYQDVRVDTYDPQFGIYSGKNDILIKGMHLDIGQNVLVMIGTELECTIKYRTLRNLSCTSEPYRPLPLTEPFKMGISALVKFTSLLQHITLTIDGFNTVLKPPFVLKPNPTILSIEPKQSIMSGGSPLIIRVRGMDSGLATRVKITFKPLLPNALTNPKNHYDHTSQKNFPDRGPGNAGIGAPWLEIMLDGCTPSIDRSNKELYRCSAPNLTKLYYDRGGGHGPSFREGKLRDEILVTSRLSVTLFGVEAYRDSYNFYTDPVYYPFRKGETHYLNPDTQQLEIKGARIDLVHTMKDIKVTIGVAVCQVIKMASTYLTCIPPRSPNDPSASNETALSVSLNRVTPPNILPTVSGQNPLQSRKNFVERMAPDAPLRTREGLEKYPVVVYAGPLTFNIGHVVYSTEPIRSNFVWAILAAILLLVFFSLFLALALWNRRRAKRLKKRQLPQSLPGMRYSELGRRYDAAENGNRYPSIRTIQNYYHPGGLPQPSSNLVPTPNDGAEETDALRASTSSSRDGESAVPGGIHSQDLDPETSIMLTDPSIMIPRDELVIGHLLGQGNFGRVYRGYWRRRAAVPNGSANVGTPDKIDTDVAVKTLNTSFADNESLKAFLNEGLRMKEFDHPYVLSLIGITWVSGESPLVVLPYMPNGDLLSHLRDPKTQPTIGNLLDWGSEISQAMDYLSTLKFVHRDLAARNCMLDADYHAIVSDFGLSRDIYEKDYYSSTNKNIKLPVKWMALESLQKNVYNSKTDVWSYGIVLWELMTRGVNPYPDVDNWDIINYLRAGRRLQQPLYCPDSLYDIMKSCWLTDPSHRPDFSALTHLVGSVISELATEEKEVIYDYNALPFSTTASVSRGLGHDEYLSPVNSPSSTTALYNSADNSDTLRRTQPSGTKDEKAMNYTDDFYPTVNSRVLNDNNTSGTSQDDGTYLN